jgi:hypothetical protein
MTEQQTFLRPSGEGAPAISRRRLLWGTLSGAVVTVFTAAGWTATAQEATPTAGVVLGEASFPAGTVAEGFAQCWFAIFELEAGASSPYPAADLTAPPLMGVALLLVTAGQLVVTPTGGSPAATPVSATPLADPMTLAAGELAALAFDPATAYIVQNPGAEPAQFLQAVAFNQSPTGGVPAPLIAVNWQGPVRAQVTAQASPTIRLFQQRLEPDDNLPAPDRGIVQLVVSEAEFSVSMRRDGSARNTSGAVLDVYIAHFAFGSEATPTP